MSEALGDDARRHLQNKTADTLADRHIVRFHPVENALARRGVRYEFAAGQRRAGAPLWANARPRLEEERVLAPDVEPAVGTERLVDFRDFGRGRDRIADDAAAHAAHHFGNGEVAMDHGRQSGVFDGHFVPATHCNSNRRVYSLAIGANLTGANFPPSATYGRWTLVERVIGDVVARRTAVEHIAKSDTAGESIPLLIKILHNDPFWGVRQTAVEGLGMIPAMTDEKTNALISALSDAKSYVRSSAAVQVGNIRTAKVSEALHKSIHDSSYSVEANSISALSKVDSVNSLPLIKARLDVRSYGNQVANAALNALATLDPVEGVNVALQKVKYGANVEGRNTALNILKQYGKLREDVKAMCAFLLGDKSRQIRFSAADFLGDVGSESQLPELETLANKKDDPASGAAKKAIEKIKERSAKGN